MQSIIDKYLLHTYIGDSQQDDNLLYFIVEHLLSFSFLTT